MISAGVALAVEGHGHGLGVPGPGYIPAVSAYAPPPQDWRKQEFLRPPAPKHTNTNNTRYNGGLNGSRLLTKYSSVGPVNLSQGSVVSSVNVTPSSEELAAYYPRLYPPPPSFTGIYPGPYAGLYSGPCTPLVRAATAAAAAAAAGYVAPPPLSPLEHQYSPPASATSPHAPNAGTAGVSVSAPGQGQGTFVSPASTQFQSAVTSVRKEMARDRDRDRERDRRVVQGFKVPSGKEGSLKHRILTHSSPRKAPKAYPSQTLSSTNNNTVLPGNFAKGSLIQLATGELRRVEDMRTEDFVLSAERSPELRLAESTVLRVCESHQNATAMITLTYNQNRTQVEFDASLEHPFFVYGQGWASCSPERTLQYYGLKVHRLQVGDILVSLTPREPGANNTTHTSHCSSGGTTYDLSRVREGGTITTTATTTAMTARQVTRASVSTAPACMSSMPPPASTGSSSSSSSNSNAHALDNSLSNSRKRRWSAPDQITDEHEQVAPAARRTKE